MRLIYQFIGFVTGLIMGVMALITVVCVFGAYFVTNEKKETEKTPKYRTRQTDSEAMNIPYPSEPSAQFMIDRLEKVIKAKGYASIRDLKYNRGLKELNSDSHFGWFNLDAATIKEEYDGEFVITFPPLLPIPENVR